MPVDETPSPWELKRNIEALRDDLKAALARAENHVTETGLAALLARVNDQLKALNDDIAQERGLREADVHALRDWAKTEHERLTKAQEKAEKRADEQERERRADRRVVYAAIASAAAALLLFILDRLQGIGP